MAIQAGWPHAAPKHTDSAISTRTMMVRITYATTVQCLQTEEKKKGGRGGGGWECRRDDRQCGMVVTHVRIIRSQRGGGLYLTNSTKSMASSVDEKFWTLEFIWISVNAVSKPGSWELKLLTAIWAWAKPGVVALLPFTALDRSFTSPFTVGKFNVWAWKSSR